MPLSLNDFRKVLGKPPSGDPMLIEMYLENYELAVRTLVGELKVKVPVDIQVRLLDLNVKERALAERFEHMHMTQVKRWLDAKTKVTDHLERVGIFEDDEELDDNDD